MCLYDSPARSLSLNSELAGLNFFGLSDMAAAPFRGKGLATGVVVA
jgi:hypothetical protein